MIRNIITSSLILFLMSTGLAFSQVPAEQDTIVVPGGFDNAGSLENTINGDTLAGGNRINPKRVYQLSKDQVYFVESPILFGGDNVNDTTSTLIIVGEKGGNKPIIFTTPKDGGNAFTHVVNGSLTLKNIYWPVTTTDGKAAPLFQLKRSEQTLRCEDLVTEGVIAGDLFNLRPVRGPMNIFFKGCYFRDNTQFTNSWNFAVFARGDNGEPIDTLWIENTTVSNSGLTFFGKLNPINFVFFDHNTIVNTPKYVFFFDQYKEAYFTNNMFINCNWQGECMATYLSQLPDGVKSGVTNLDTIDVNLWQLGHGYVPEQKDVKWLSSNNLHFTSPYLNKYYAGEYDDDPANYPISTRDWGFLPAGVTVPTQVENVPPVFINDKTQALIDAYDMIVEESNYKNTLDPLMHTKGIASQEIGDIFAKKAMLDYGVAPAGVTLTDDDKVTLAFGDRDPGTVPGIESENGAGFADVTDLVEDFAYDADVTSSIDGRHLGSLQWFPGEMSSYDGAAALAEVKDYHAKVAVQLPDRQATTVWNPAGNAASTGLWSERLNWTDGRVPLDNKVVFNVPGAQAAVLDVESSVRYFVLGDNGGADDSQIDSLIIAAGGVLNTGAHWSGIGWNSRGTMIVNEGGTVNFGEHMWVGWNSHAIVEINGGIVNVAQMYGTAFEGQAGTGKVYVNAGELNLTGFHPDNSIPDGSVLDISGGKVTIPGNFTNIFNNHIAAGKITAFGGDATYYVNVVYDETANQTIMTGVKVGVAENLSNIPDNFSLEQNYPNPFNPETTINYSLPKNADVTVSVYNLTGQLIRTLVNSNQQAGYQKVVWDGRNDMGQMMPTGMYFYRLQTPSFVATRKMMFMK